MSLTCTAYRYSAARCFQKCLILCLFLLPVTKYLHAQLPETTVTEQLVENMTETNNDNEPEDDSFLQQMEQYLRHPLNLNTASAYELESLKLLTPLQVQNFIAYRNLLGRLIDMYELQAVPGWDVKLLVRLRPYITVSTTTPVVEAIKYRLHNGERNLLLRLAQVLEKQKGYIKDTAGSYYQGAPQKILLRYKYQYKNLLQYGILAEKDAGEQFFRGSRQQGFDFYSAHFFIRNAGIIQSLALGDFSVNLGQGLIQWQSMAAKKTASVLSIKQEAEVLRPYNAAGEINFHRGAGITIKKGSMAATLFASYKKTDASFVADTLTAAGGYITSLRTSGYHRTKTENAGKGIQQQLAAGGNISYTHNRFHTGINMVQYRFKLPFKKDGSLYNLYDPDGRALAGYSIDYSYTFRNMHFFGEAAVTGKSGKGFISGMLMSVAPAADVSVLYRNISAGYQALYAASFTESISPSGEKGLYMGLAIHPANAWRLDAYADICKFPWLRYRVNAPSVSTDYLLQLSYTPNKQAGIYSRLRFRSNALNQNPGGLPLSPIEALPQKNWRIQASVQLTPQFTWQGRIEMVWYGKGEYKEQGFLGYSDFFYRPRPGKWMLNMRLQFFDTESYNSRLYSYENDVPYSYSSPVFYEKGHKYYLNSSYNINSKVIVYLKLARLIFFEKETIGSGPEQVAGNHKTEFKLQLQYKF